METLVVGASGATGQHLVDELLHRGERVRIIVRSVDRLPSLLKDRANLSVTEASLLALSDEELVRHVEGCRAVASCLGHTLSFRGIYGQPRRLVTDATRRLCAAIRRGRSDQPVKFLLMNTTGNRNKDLNETVSTAESVVLWLLRNLLPPHADNEQAAEYLRTKIGQKDPAIQWVAVRPDGLVDHAAVSNYTLHPSPTTSAIFNAGSTSRINVGHLMAELITKPTVWDEWRGRMPVIYNAKEELVSA